MSQSVLLAIAAALVYGGRESNALVVPRDDDGDVVSPFLIAPPDLDDNDVSSIISSAMASRTSTRSSATSIHSSATSAASSNTGPSTTTSGTSDSIIQAATPDIEGGKQPSSIRFVIPVFLLIVLTICGYFFTRYRSRRRREQDDPFPSDQSTAFGPSGGWKEVQHDEDDEKDDPWYAGEEDAKAVTWDEVNLHTLGRGNVMSVAGKGWGWKETFNAWRSARGRAETEAAELGIDEMGQRTVKLVTQRSETYQTLPVQDVDEKYGLDGEPLEGERPVERGSIRALRDKLAALTYRSSPPKKPLERNKNATKRKLIPKQAPPPPEEPIWIRPRAVSPTSQLFSPPLQPHLFFPPTPSTLDVPKAQAASESGSEYGSDEESASVMTRSHARMPTIPSTAEKLAESYTAIPPRTPRTPRTPKVEGEVEPPRPQTVGRSSKKTPDDVASKLKRNPTAPTPSWKVVRQSIKSGPGKTEQSSSANLQPEQEQKNEPKEKGTPVKSPGLKRSKANQDLASPSPIRPSAPKREKTTTSIQTESSKKSKSKSQQRKMEKAQDQVESILQASWLDRALASPPSGWVGMSSPGVEEMGGGMGIEQRLGMLKRLEG